MDLRHERFKGLKKFLDRLCKNRSSRFQKSFKIDVLKKFCNIHRKKSVLESLFNKVACHQACNFIKKRLKHRCFPVNIAKSL